MEMIKTNNLVKYIRYIYKENWDRAISEPEAWPDF